ncbi:DEAD-like helicase [Fusarium albosuccineum]|uniref:DNA 3'-5' helicase n=1 Tax=Fusarium albosuccineum TaxID=1237068 RepID=A0A8H4L7X7_9HYPO|nr:DEAD-like helicase [Fusarium albosuccineum]
MGPETAAGWFRSIATNPTFKRHVCVVAVDELHLVAIWGRGIRPQYAQLSLLRRRPAASSFDRRDDPATDDKEIHKPVLRSPGRHNERLASAREHSEDCDLYRLPARYPKCAECLRAWLLRLSAGVITARDCKQIIQVYHSHTTQNDKDAIYEEFFKADSKIRIMVATESLGTGVDLSDVIRVVQYGFPLERLLCVLIQRFGRAARMAGIKGEAIFLVESWAIGDRISPKRPALLCGTRAPPCLRGPSNTSQLAQSHCADPGVDSDIPDDESDVAADAVELPAPGPYECCNVCNPDLTRTVPLPWDTAASLRIPRAGTASRAFLDRLVLLGDKIVNSAHRMMKPELSARILTQKGEWISMSAEYANTHSAAQLRRLAKSIWVKDHSDELFKKFNEIKSYVVTNWPGGYKPGTAAAVPQQTSQKRKASVEAETLMTPDQERRVLSAQKREQYASSLERIIAKAREASGPCSPYPHSPALSIASANSSLTSMGRSATPTGVGYSSTISGILEDSKVEVTGVGGGDRASEGPASRREKGVTAKRVALGVLDSNARRSLRRNKGNNTRYDHSEWVL